MRCSVTQILVLTAFFLLIWYFIISSRTCTRTRLHLGLPLRNDTSGRGVRNDFAYNNELPLIFIGGFPRSGTTLLRAMLDAHPDIRCGEETRIIPRILGMRSQWKKDPKEWHRLEEAGVDDTVLDPAVSSFILEVIVRHGPLAHRLCDKDPFVLKSVSYLARLFPNSKFVFMIRDGRAAVHSMISRGVTVTGFDLKDYRQCLTKWSATVAQMYRECQLAGGDRCFPLYYEQLVLHPEQSMRELLSFLDIPWNEAVLNHEKFIGKKISLSKTEKSTDQVIKPLYTSSLTLWVGKIPTDVVHDMGRVAPMLAFLGYDPHSNPPDYGKADDLVRLKAKELNNVVFWRNKLIEIFNRSRNSF
ncbi:protein tyrosine sulfotransferase A [Trichuris trichiura]|uniref:Protein-tyrosine sulfotransferase n=1 Tax=Trichuris trichiura TaxID=36087 RepID=A0A077ZCW5_TRITR|nr:protein tyrosine sulfotransferase A [Trichuris trichiura]